MVPHVYADAHNAADDKEDHEFKPLLKIAAD
jgi:hypothetical protein